MKVNFNLGAVALFCIFSLTNCGGGSGSSSPSTSVPNDPVVSDPPPTPIDTVSDNTVKVNQLGYLPSSSKTAIVPETSETTFNLVDAITENVVFTGTLSTASLWTPSQESVHIADFSSFSNEGEFFLQIEGFENSLAFSISTDVLLDAHDAALKAYYFNRASTELSGTYANAWARPMGHPDTEVLIHSSAASAERPVGSVISGEKGWYDAGDYNKYIVNSGISTYTLLLSYLHHSSFYNTRNGNIPESTNNVPDILDEVMWNLEWMQSMQDPNDGGVYHKLTTLNFSGAVMPHEATNTRFVVQKGTGASLNFAAVMAIASRVYGQFPELAEVSASFREASIRAYDWAEANPTIEYQQPSDVQTGVYGDSDFAGEFAWAAAELYLTTQDTAYLDVFNQNATSPGVPWWQNTMALGYFSLLSEGENLLSAEAYSAIEMAVVSLADSIVTSHTNSAYATAMEQSDFVWGSNSGAMNKALVLLQAFSVTSDSSYHEAATGLVDYVLGKNPLDRVFVTGIAASSPNDPHHRQSFADDVNEAVPGLLVGGPHTGEQDGCDYEGDQPATTYLDDWCSFSTNEVTINWNAPLVYVLAALHSRQ